MLSSTEDSRSVRLYILSSEIDIQLQAISISTQTYEFSLATGPPEIGSALLTVFIEEGLSPSRFVQTPMFHGHALCQLTYLLTGSLQFRMAAC